MKRVIHKAFNHSPEGIAIAKTLPTATGGSWWATESREGFTASAAKRFDGCSFPSHHKPRKPKAVYPSTTEAIANRADRR